MMAYPGKYHQHIVTIQCAWDQVAQTLWRRYPNPYSKHVLSEDTFSRRVEGSKLLSKRLLSKVNRAPRWMEKFVGEGAHGCIVEESIVDCKAKTFTTYTRNINFTKMMTVVEKNTFYVSSENENWTCCLKQAWVKCNIFGISKAVEKFGVDRYKKNAKKAELGLEHVIGVLFTRTLGRILSPK